MVNQQKEKADLSAGRSFIRRANDISLLVCPVVFSLDSLTCCLLCCVNNPSVRWSVLSVRLLVCLADSFSQSVCLPGQSAGHGQSVGHQYRIRALFVPVFAIAVAVAVACQLPLLEVPMQCCATLRKFSAGTGNVLQNTCRGHLKLVICATVVPAFEYGTVVARDQIPPNSQSYHLDRNRLPRQTTPGDSPCGTKTRSLKT